MWLPIGLSRVCVWSRLVPLWTKPSIFRHRSPKSLTLPQFGQLSALASLDVATGVCDPISHYVWVKIKIELRLQGCV